MGLMGVSIRWASTRLVLLLFWVVFCKNSLALSSPSSSTICWRHKLEDAVLVQGNQCPDSDGNPAHKENLMASSRVTEVNGTTLESALQKLKTQDNMYVAVLVHARWCPFSRSLRPMFDSLSSAFPSICHLVVEEAALQSSAFSQSEVHSFPALFLHNKTARVRYHGFRTVDGIGQFYEDFTGLGPLKQSNRGTDGRASPSKKREPELSATPLERVLHDDVYLMLATIFLVLRVLCFLLPGLLSIVKHHLARHTSWQVHRGYLRRIILRGFEQEWHRNGASRQVKGKNLKKDLTQETGKVLLSVPRWPSSPLAAVTLAEGSSSKGIHVINDLHLEAVCGVDYH